MEQKTKDILVKILLTIPMASWLIIVPILLKRYNFLNPLKGQAWYYTSDYLSDFFLYYKSKWTMITAILMIIVLMVVYIIEQELRLCIKDLKIFIPMVVYTLMAIISTVASDYKDFALWGCPDQFEGLFVLLSYMVGMYYFYHIFRHYDMTGIFMVVETISCIPVLIICLSQFFKHDILQYLIKSVKITVEPGDVYGSFYNVDYTAMYMILLIPLFTIVVIYAQKMWMRILSGVIVLGMLLSVKGSGTVTGKMSIAIVVVLVFLLVVMRMGKQGKLDKKTTISIIVAVILVAIGGVLFITTHIDKKSTEMHDLEHVYTRDDCIQVVYKGNTYYIAYAIDQDLNFSLYALDGDQETLNINLNTDDAGDQYMSIDDDTIGDLRFKPEVFSSNPLVMGFSMQIGSDKWYFSREVGDGTYYYLTAVDCYDKITEENESADFAPLVGHDRLATHRGFIWNKAIVQILNHNLLIGSGPDSFVMTFPNDDYVDVYNNHYMNMVMTKPHCLYLQMAAQTGLPSAIAFIVFYVWYFITSLKLYSTIQLDTPLKRIGLAILLGTVGYMFSGIINDSSVTAAFLFWGLMGIGTAINFKINEK